MMARVALWVTETASETVADWMKSQRAVVPSAGAPVHRGVGAT
jgi:hypothetical protein